jgi:hypothetical protein
VKYTAFIFLFFPLIAHSPLSHRSSYHSFLALTFQDSAVMGLFSVNTSQQRESMEEGFVDPDGNIVVSKKMTRVVTTTRTTFEGGRCLPFVTH